MRKKIFQNNEGISPVLGFILILAIGVSLLSTIQLSFVPVWNTQEELDHIKLMQDDLKVLKSNIESGIQSGTTLSSPLTMGLKYSPKMFVYNPRDEAYASLEISNNTWVEVRYNEVFPEGMTDETSIKNISTGMITYSLRGAQNYNSFILENGLIRRSGSDYTTNSQNVLANNTIFVPSLKALEYGTTSGVEKRTVNIYPTSQQKNSVIGENVWLILHTDPAYVDWWATNLKTEGATVRKKDTTNGIVIANISSSVVIKMGEAYISTSQKTSPPHSPATRIVKVSGTGTSLPVGGTTSITVEVQDEYNNPVPNVAVSFSINTTRTPGNAGSTANLSQNSGVSGTDGRVTLTLMTKDAGFHYIDATLPGYETTLVYSASSQGSILKLDPPTGSDPEYNVIATLMDSLGSPLQPKPITFDTNDGFFSTLNPKNTTVDGTAGITLNVSNASGIKITNIQVKDTTTNATNITWDTNNIITLTAKSGYVFNSRDFAKDISTTGCVFYGTSSGSYTNISSPCKTGSPYSVSLTGLSANTAYYFIVNGSRPGGSNVNSTEYMFVTGEPLSMPASVTNLSYTSGPLNIKWTWDEPTGVDHVELYVDNPPSMVVSGQRQFNAFYFRPNSTHTIYIRTVDIDGHANTTWMNLTAKTSPSVFDYVFNLSAITFGTVNNFNNARSDNDSGASAQFYEANIAAIPDSNNDTNVTAHNDTLGTTTIFANMQSASDGGSYATLSEGIVVSSDFPISPAKSIINGSQNSPLTYDPIFLDATGNIDITQPTNITEQVTLIPNSLGVTGEKARLADDICCSTTITNANKGTPTSLTLAERNSLSSDDGTTTTVQRSGLSNNDERINMSFTLTGVETVNWIKIRSKFRTTGASDALRFGMWNYATSAFDSKNTSTATSTMKELSYNISSPSDKQNYISTSGNTIYVNVIDWGFGGSIDTIDTTYFEAVVNYVPTKYSTGITYTYTVPNPNSSWINITVTDSSYADGGTDVSVYNQTSSAWESIRTSVFTGGLLPQPHVNKVILNPSNYDTGSGIIKFKYEGIDLTTNGNIGVDLLKPQVYYNTYGMNITTNISSIASDTQYTLQTNYKLENTNETYNMDIWNFASSTWVNTQSLTYTSWIQNNVTLTSDQISGGQVKTRFTDQTPTGNAPGKLFIDFQRIYGFTAGTPVGYHLDITTDTIDIPEANNLPVLQLKYTVSGGNFTVLVKNGTTSGWDSVTILNATGMPYRNITLTQDELLPDVPFSGNMPQINKSYVRVRYQDESPLLNGTLDLDYQRVYSS